MAKKIWSKLPKADKKHLKEGGIRYKWQFVNQIKFMKELIKKYPEQHQPYCWECRMIAKKLGMWED